MREPESMIRPFLTSAVRSEASAALTEREPVTACFAAVA